MVEKIIPSPFKIGLDREHFFQNEHTNGSLGIGNRSFNGMLVPTSSLGELAWNLEL